MADEHDLAALAMMNLGFAVHLGDQRAGGVELEQIAGARRFRHRLGDAVRGEDDGLAGIRDLVELLDEDRAFRLELFDDVAVVDDLVADIDRRTETLERELDDLDRPVDAGAEAPRRAEKDVKRRTEGLAGIGCSGHGGYKVREDLHVKPASSGSGGVAR